MIKNETTPKLAPPGAGIPWPQKVILKLIVAPFVANRTDWSTSEERFKKITNKILHEVSSLTEEQLNLRVLVPPQRGLEDSSRFWSIAMTLEHLVIVGRAIVEGISLFGKGEIPQSPVDIAKVKPFGKISSLDSLDLFKKFTLEEYPKFVSALTEQQKNSSVKFEHPWFGHLNSKQWFWLLSVHQGIHLEQIRAIKKGGEVPR